MRITIRCPIFPTESSDLVMSAFRQIIPTSDTEFIEEQSCTWIQSRETHESFLSTLKEMIHENRVIDAARKILWSSWTGTTASIKIDKQAASCQKLRLVDQNEDLPLGTIDITIFFEDDSQFESFLSWFTPPTKDGRIIRV